MEALRPYLPYLQDPRVWGGALGLVVLVVLVLVLRRRRPKVQGQVFDDSVGRARTRLKADIRAFRDDIPRAVSGAGTVFRKIEGDTSHGEVIGHHRREANHSIRVKAPDFGTLKQTARTLGYDSMAISQLEAHWRKVERQVMEFNTGRMDASKTPIATVKTLEKDLQSAIVLVNMCVTQYSR